MPLLPTYFEYVKVLYYVYFNSNNKFKFYKDNLQITTHLRFIIN